MTLVGVVDGVIADAYPDDGGSGSLNGRDRFTQRFHRAACHAISEDHEKSDVGAKTTHAIGGVNDVELVNIGGLFEERHGWRGVGVASRQCCGFFWLSRREKEAGQSVLSVAPSSVERFDHVVVHRGD
ncbi:MAG: hypothetical protein E2O99_03345, partial [Acidobacteria bacterium]